MYIDVLHDAAAWSRHMISTWFVLRNWLRLVCVCPRRLRLVSICPRWLGFVSVCSRWFGLVCSGCIDLVRCLDQLGGGFVGRLGLMIVLDQLRRLVCLLSVVVQVVLARDVLEHVTGCRVVAHKLMRQMHAVLSKSLEQTFLHVLRVVYSDNISIKRCVVGLVARPQRGNVSVVKANLGGVTVVVPDEVDKLMPLHIVVGVLPFDRVAVEYQHGDRGGRECELCLFGEKIRTNGDFIDIFCPGSNDNGQDDVYIDDTQDIRWAVIINSTMATFIKNVERYVELHKNLAEAAKTTKDMRKEKTILGKELLEYMMQHQIADHVHDGFEIINKIREVKNKLSVEMIEGMLENFVNENLDAEKIDRIVTAIVESEMSGDTKNALVVKKVKEPKKPRGKKGQDTETEGDYGLE